MVDEYVLAFRMVPSVVGLFVIPVLPVAFHVFLDGFDLLVHDVHVLDHPVVGLGVQRDAVLDDVDLVGELVEVGGGLEVNVLLGFFNNLAMLCFMTLIVADVDDHVHDAGHGSFRVRRDFLQVVLQVLVVKT